MNENLKILDRFDRDRNIYELVVRFAERAYKVIGGTAAVEGGGQVQDPIRAVLEESLAQQEPGDV